MADEITISFDGVEVTTQPGKMVLEAAIDAGIYVPYLCYHPGMEPFAACRMCVVAVEGQRGFPASCTLPVQDGMRVRNAASDVDQLRHSVMEMLIAEHPNGCLTCHRIDICGPGDICLRHVAVNDRCVTCPKNERCELKDTVRYLGMNLESPLDYKYRQIPLEVADPFYDRDYNLCIVCGRCVRACDEIRGDNAIAFTERSGQALVGASFGASLLESGCEFCGACIDVCPVGALVERDHKWEKARRVERSICPHCPVGCQLNLEFNDRDQLIRAIPEINSPANRGQACFKGKFGLEYVNDPARLSAPLLRRDGLLQEASWDEALDYVAARLPGYTGKSFALLTSPTSTNEEHYLAQKFARSVMGSNNVDHTSNTHPELVLDLEHSLGIPAATNSIWDLAQAGSILVFNSNVTGRAERGGHPHQAGRPQGNEAGGHRLAGSRAHPVRPRLAAPRPGYRVAPLGRVAERVDRGGAGGRGVAGRELREPRRPALRSSFPGYGRSVPDYRGAPRGHRRCGPGLWRARVRLHRLRAGQYTRGSATRLRSGLGELGAADRQPGQAGYRTLSR